MQDLGNTQFFRVETDNNSVKMILDEVYHALTEKGYNPVNQIVGYIMSGDPTYITSYKLISLHLHDKTSTTMQEVLS